MIGSSVRDSTNTASASSASPPPTSSAVQPDAQSNLFPASDDQISSVDTPEVISRAPSQSMRTLRRTTGRCSVFCSSAMDSRLNGTPIRKHQRQPSQDVSTRTPPISGPAMVPTPNTAPKMPAYRPSSRGGIMAAMTIVASAVMPPAPMPWMTRLSSSTSTFGVKPATSEPATNRPRESWMRSFLL